MIYLWFLLVVCDGFFFFKQKTAYEMRISDWSSDVCSSDLPHEGHRGPARSRDGGAPGGAGGRRSRRGDGGQERGGLAVCGNSAAPARRVSPGRRRLISQPQKPRRTLDL